MPTYVYKAFACYVPIPAKCRTCMNDILKTSDVSFALL